MQYFKRFFKEINLKKRISVTLKFDSAKVHKNIIR